MAAEADRQIIRLRKSSQKKLTRVKNQIKSFLNLHNITWSTKDGNSWTKKHLLWLENLEFEIPNQRLVIDEYLNEYHFLRNQIAKLTRQLREMSKNDRYSKNFKRLVSCKGVGLITAMTFLLELHELPYTVVGKHYGGKFSAKLFGYPVRVWQLFRFLRKQHVDVAISQSTFHSPITAWFLGVPVIYMNDNEHALGNIPSFIFATKILIPEFLDPKKAMKQCARKSKIIQYPGVKEGIYLWNADIHYLPSSEKK